MSESNGAGEVVGAVIGTFLFFVFLLVVVMVGGFCVHGVVSLFMTGWNWI